MGTTIDREGLIGEHSVMVPVLFTSDDELQVEATTWLHIDVDAGMFETVVYDESGNAVVRHVCFDAETATDNHERVIEHYGINGVTEGDSCDLFHAARYSQWKNLPYRPSFALAGVEPWG